MLAHRDVCMCGEAGSQPSIVCLLVQYWQQGQQCFPPATSPLPSSDWTCHSRGRALWRLGDDNSGTALGWQKRIVFVPHVPRAWLTQQAHGITSSVWLVCCVPCR